MGEFSSCDESETVFESTIYRYRIPAIFYHKDTQTLLAFAEQRKGIADETADKLVMKQGKLEKKSSKWTVQWKEFKVVEEAQLRGHRSMNPCPVSNKTTKKLFLFFICVQDGVTEQQQLNDHYNQARLCYITSEDLGKKWSGVTPVQISLPDHSVILDVGPGHGLQTQGGRMIVPAYVYTGVEHAKPKPHAASIFSDNDGKNWWFGKIISKKSVECQMAEVCEDEHRFIYCNARTEGKYRVEAFSRDNGSTFSLLEKKKWKLRETPKGCHGSVISFPAQSEDEKASNTWLLFTHPTKGKENWERCDLGVYLNTSPSDPAAWSKPWIIWKGATGYSDLAYIDDGWFACLFECGETKNTDKIAIRLFDYSSISSSVSKEDCCCSLL
ncbi:sialidase-3-like [Kryptolebias marmoratus]|uniref:exo-alpha-sialidase n=1 Tax=Kryptolebias marmoratus TaxID=37003 RepID=A0A3Q3BLG6_KRYMA|nr:sialidase-3-like [Kryptolebias marmoratus]